MKTAGPYIRFSNHRVPMQPSKGANLATTYPRRLEALIFDPNPTCPWPQLAHPEKKMIQRFPCS
eukprot:658782-Amorphochlora_amoeboformis.AAC.1